MGRGHKPHPCIALLGDHGYTSLCSESVKKKKKKKKREQTKRLCLAENGSLIKYKGLSHFSGGQRKAKYTLQLNFTSTHRDWR